MEANTTALAFKDAGKTNLYTLPIMFFTVCK